MRTRPGSQERFSSITVEGAVLPSDLLRRIGEGDRSLEGLTPEDYHLPAGERINEAVSRSWTYLLGRWLSFKERRNALEPGESGRAMTRDQWLFPLFKELGYGQLQKAEAFVLDEKSYPISHGYMRVPIHLVGCGVDLDRRKKGEPGASESSPHSLLQEFLNRSHMHLWGIVANGLKLRLLRDNVSLTRQAFIEFDLEVMMEEEVYADFFLLWLLCHQSRVEGDNPEECRLEGWHRYVRASGVRLMDKLREGVEQAIISLGRGFLRHKANTGLMDGLHSGGLSTLDYYRQLLRLVYRLIFLFVAESRDLLLVPGVSQEIRSRYYDYYSISRLRRLAARRRGSSHWDLWQAVRLVFSLLGRDEGYPDLGLPGLGTFLWSREAIPDVMECVIDNRDFLEAVYNLCFVVDNNVLQRVDYKNLGPEELGSVYEALLELHPEINSTDGFFELKSTGGSERKTSGSYYTPTGLIVSLLDSALEPALRERKTEKEVLGLKVCDPACGSGHFLLAAAHRIARRLASLRTGEPEPSPRDLRAALRDVIGHCIYGVDINPMSVELCKVGLWMEALEPGKPLSFLDHHIVCGNSLMGAYPAFIKRGIPDDAFDFIEGDDKGVCKKYRVLNKQERGAGAARSLFDAAGEAWARDSRISLDFENLDAIDDSSLEGVRKKEAAYKRITGSDNYHHYKLAADAWCAAFVWKKVETETLRYPIHEEVFRNIEKNPLSTPRWLKDEIDRLAGQYHFFHYYLVFPEVFRLPVGSEAPDNPHTGWNGGFDVVLGNPPWEHIELKEKEFFASSRVDISNSMTSIREKLIEQLKNDKDEIYNEYIEKKRHQDSTTHFIRNSNKFPLNGGGRINTYAVFSEINRYLINSRGYIGCIVPSGIATDDTTKFFFQDLIDTRALVSLYDFENRKKLFPAVDSRMKFCLLTLTGKKRPVNEGAKFIFFAHDTADLSDKDRVFSLSAEDIALVNPNTHTCPIFRYNRDAELVKQIYRKVPVLIDEYKNKNIWNISFKQGLFNMATDSNLFRTEQDLLNDGWELDGNRFRKGTHYYYPLYEAKMIHQYNHRFGDYRDLPVDSKSTQLPDVPAERLADHHYTVFPRYWVDLLSIDNIQKNINYNYKWFLGFRDVTNTTNERTVLFSIVPISGVGHTMPLCIMNIEPHMYLPFLANMNSFIFDFTARQKVGGLHLTFFILKQLPVLAPEMYFQLTEWDLNAKLLDWINSRVLELVYTSCDMRDFAKDCGYEGEPFKWDEERRFLLRCQLDAAYFHLYGISEKDADYIMNTFPIVKRKDIAKYGTFHTKDKILEIYRELI